MGKTLRNRVTCSAVAACLFTVHASADDQTKGEAVNDTYYLINPLHCALDPVMLEESDALVLDRFGYGNHYVDCRFSDEQDFEADLGKALIVGVTCQDATETWQDELNVILPQAGIVAIKPLSLQGRPTLFSLCP